MSRWKKVSSLIQKKSFATTLQRTSYTFTPDKDEVIESRFRLRYSTTCNSYYRDWVNTIDPSSKGVIPGWEKALYSVDNVHRYINEEIGQVYLEKVPGSSTGCIKWRMDFGCSGLLVDEVTMRLKCVEDYGGEIMITLMGSPGHKRLRYAVGSDYVTYTELENSPELVLTIHFVGDAGQVTQLFPQNILRDMGYPLDIQVTLKPPFQSLGYPRILVGVMYSSSQEIEVDVRHYKENTSQQSGRGFLHIHLYRGRDLPQENNRLPDTFTKCYLLPDAKKSTKCKTRTRKGKDPYWDEQFLVVDINYHEIKRRALEVYVGDSNTAVGKRAKFIGGLRLSLGYNAVVSAQTQKVNQVLHLLKGKGGQITNSKGETGEGKDGHMKVPQLGKLNTTAPKWRGASFARMVIESAKERSNDQDDEEEANCNVKETNISKNGEEIDAGDRPSSLKNKSDIHATGTDKAKDNQTGRLSSTLSTEEQTLAYHLDQERSSNAKLEKGLKVDNDHDVKEKAVEGNCETKVSCSNLPKDKEDISEVTPDLKRLCEERKHNADGEGEIETNEALNSQLPTPNTKEVREFCETADEVNSNSKSDENLSPHIKDDNDELENSKIQISSAGPVDGQQQNSETQPSAKDQSEMIELEKSSPTQQLETSNEDSKINHEEEPCRTQTTESNKSNGTQEIVEVCNKVESTEKEDSENHSFHHHQGQQQQELESLPQSVEGLTKQLSPVACFNTGNDKDIKADSLDSLTSLWKEDNCNDMNTCNDTEDLEKGLTIINCQLENDRDEPMGLDQNERFINETKIETPVNCDVENNFNELKAGTDENSLEKNRKREAKLSNLCESSNPENEQKVEKQNGLETNVLKSESLAPVETEKKNHLLNNALKKEKKREVTETIKGEKTTESLSLPKQEEVKLKNVESENNTEQAENKKASGELHEVKRSPSASLRDLSKKLNFKRRSKLNEEETKGTDKNLETGANKIMLDAQGLEITQWNLMVERPKQWHYCWHILRSEMTLLH